MKQALTITVYPASLSGDYLSVSDAMRQMLDLVDALASFESVEGSSRKIVWRLVDAHTNSPPFTITAQAYPVDPVVSVSFEAQRTVQDFTAAMQTLIQGVMPSWIDDDSIAPIKRILSRNQNAVGRTEIIIDDEIISIVPSTAKLASIAIAKSEIVLEAEALDLRHTEYGSVECIVYGITRWNNKPALSVLERLSGDKLTCVLNEDVAEKLGNSRKWEEVWQGRRLLATGALHYGQDGSLKRIDAEDADDLPFTIVDLHELQSLDILQGRSVSEHLQLLREE
ncbi:hypothetical protein [Methylobacterium sp. Leaf93]|uniref:hypothetical protein n=1 Tax=Methylobacterium sp. Leaf93 TaxID=1736249 RepID=UPI000AA79B38|nr:hypothetical protein [Methylobacterium sp. Leaf93]